MKIRIFTGASMKAVMAEVRDALGPDAVILSSRKQKNGTFEVQAAIETVRRAAGDTGEKHAEAIAREADLEQRLRQDLLGVMRTETLRSKSAKRTKTTTSNIPHEVLELPQAGNERREDGWVRTGTLGIVSRRI